MKKNYAEIAANWWCEKIEEQNPHIDSKLLKPFKLFLIIRVDESIRKEAHIKLSTYRGFKSETLFEVAHLTGVDKLLPPGFEMMVTPDIGVTVYDSCGMLVPMKNVSLRCVC